MLEYEKFLPLMRKYRGKTLIRKLCRIEGAFTTSRGYFWFSRTYLVERVWHDGKRYIQRYGGYHMIPEAEALKADKIEVNKYVGKSELTVDLIYDENNPLTHEFIRKQLREEPLDPIRHGTHKTCT